MLIIVMQGEKNVNAKLKMKKPGFTSRLLRSLASKCRLSFFEEGGHTLSLVRV